MRRFFTHRGVSVAVSLIIAATLTLMPVSSGVSVQTAEAGGGAGGAVTVVGGNGTIQETISAGANTIVAGLQNAFFIKEFTLDGIAHGLAKLVLKSMTQSILNWINSGFQGSPAFVTDLKQYLRDRIDQTIGEYIYNDPALSFLCSPFQLDVRIALAVSYQESAHDGFGSKAQCTLSEVTDNIEGFLSGSFSEGGWEGWFELTQNPVNTPEGARLAAETEMYARIVDEQGNTIKELDWGDGFLSFKVCADTDRQQNCDITTPGRVIADQINKSLGAGQDALISADEINEIITALFAQLAQMALTGINGLLGLGSSSYSDNSFGASGASSYLDALSEESEVSGGVVNPFTDAVERETESTTLQNEIITLVNQAESRLDAAVAEHGSCISLRLPAELIAARDTAELRTIRNNQNATLLRAQSAEFAATTDAAVQLELTQSLTRAQQNGTYTALSENSLLRIRIDTELEPAVSAFRSSLASAVNRCDSNN